MNYWTNDLDALEQNKVTSPTSGRVYSMTLEVSLGRLANERYHVSEYVGDGQYSKVGSGEGYRTYREAVEAVLAWDNKV